MSVGTASGSDAELVRDRGAILTTPWFISALALWAINDHVLKAQFHNACTGKLSDVACLVAIPALFAGAYEMLMPRPTRVGSRRVLVTSAGLAVTVMVLINTLPIAAEAYRVAMGVVRYPLDAVVALFASGDVLGIGRARFWMDASDVFTVPAALLPIWLSAKRRSSAAARLHAKFLPTLRK